MAKIEIQTDDYGFVKELKKKNPSKLRIRNYVRVVGSGTGFADNFKFDWNEPDLQSEESLLRERGY